LHPDRISSRQDYIQERHTLNHIIEQEKSRQNILLSWFIRFYGWLTQRLYHEFAWAYDPVSWLVSLGQWDPVRNIALNKLVGRRILEVGFGTGELVMRMKDAGYRVTGLDRSPQMHAVTLRKLKKKGYQVPLVRAVTQNLPFINSGFDTIVSTFPAGYILDPATWSEMARVLRSVTANDVLGSPGGGFPGRIVVIGAFVWRGRLEDASSDASEDGLEDGPRVGAKAEQVRIRFTEQFEQLCNGAGLRFSLETHRHNNWIVPVIIAEKTV